MRRSGLWCLLILVVACSSADKGGRLAASFLPSDSVTAGPPWDAQGPYGREAHAALIRQGLTALYGSEQRQLAVNGTYTALIDSIGTDRLGVLLPPGVSVRVTFASESGFVAIGKHSAGTQRCGIWTGVVPDSLRPPATDATGSPASSGGQLWCSK